MGVQLRQTLCHDWQPLLRSVELVVVSPLSRALDTALGAFPRSPPEPSPDCGRAGGPAPMLALALASERLDTACDIGQPRSQLEQQYPDVDFSEVEEHWWH